MRAALAVLAALALPSIARATTVDFEAQGTAAPAFLSPSNRPQTLTINGATFAGGSIVRTTSDFVADDAPADFTAAYTTLPYTGFTNPLTITFGSAVNNVSFALVNNIAGNYLVTTNTGFSQGYTVGDYANQLIALTGAGITNVSIRYTTPLQSPLFDFAIDDVNFQAAAAAVPEASTWALMLSGLGVLGATLRRRKRHAAGVQTA